MDIVSHAGAVGRIVVVAEHIQVIAAADGNLCDEGHEVVRNAAGIFPDQTAAVGADGVEVAQQTDGEIVHRVGGVAQDLLGHILGPAIGVGAVAGVGGLAQRHLVVAGIDRGGGGEDDVFHTVVAHGLTQADGGEEVVVVIFQRHCDRFAHGLEPGKVDRTVDVMLFKDPVKGRAVAHVVFVEVDMPAGDLLNALDGLGAGVDKIVNNDDVVSAL